MMDWTDRHCRYFLRLVEPARAALHRDGHAPARCSSATCRGISTSIRPSIRWRCSSAAAIRTRSRTARRLGEAWGYDEINLNVGCPSRARADRQLRRVPDGRARAGGATASRRCATRSTLPVTVKHRIGIDDGRGLRASCATSSARSRMRARRRSSCTRATRCSRDSRRRRTARCRRSSTTYVHRLKRDFPRADHRDQRRHRDARRDRDASSHSVDGVMLGRAAYHDPWLLAQVDGELLRRRTLTRARAPMSIARDDALRRATARSAASPLALDRAAHARALPRPAGRTPLPADAVRRATPAGRRSRRCCSKRSPRSNGDASRRRTMRTGASPARPRRPLPQSFGRRDCSARRARRSQVTWSAFLGCRAAGHHPQEAIGRDLGEDRRADVRRRPAAYTARLPPRRIRARNSTTISTAIQRRKTNAKRRLSLKLLARVRRQRAAQARVRPQRQQRLRR